MGSLDIIEHYHLDSVKITPKVYIYIYIGMCDSKQLVTPNIIFSAIISMIVMENPIGIQFP